MASKTKRYVGIWEASIGATGRRNLFNSPEDLWKAAKRYFKYCDENPLLCEKVFCSNGEILTHDLRKAIPYTLDGMFIYLRTTKHTWSRIRNTQEFKDICQQIEGVMRTQKFAGAAAGIFSPSLIIRDIGLADKQEINHTGDLTVNAKEASPESLKLIAELNRRKLQEEKELDEEEATISGMEPGDEIVAEGE